jgi:hypothetical protein
LLGLFVVIAFPGQVAGTHSFFYRDFGLFGYPVAHFARESFWREEIPFWNPLNNCGLPFMAQWNTMVFYPGTLLYLLAPLPWALNYFCLLHLFLAAAGMYSLAEEWTKNRFAASVAGFAFAFNGLTLHALMWPNNIAALGWMPWVVLTVQGAYREGGRRIVSAIIVAALQLFTGAPEIILLTWLIVGGLWLSELTTSEISRHKLLGRLLLCGLIAGAIAAVQLLPFLELLRESRRSAAVADAYWSMPSWGMANFFVPLFGCTPSILGIYSQDTQQWTSSYYIGVGVLAIAMIGVRSRGLARMLFGLAVLGIICAMGEKGIVYTWLRKVVPVLGYVRFPVKWIVLTIFSVPAVAGFGIAWLERSDYPKRPLYLVGTVFALIIAGLLIISVIAPIPGTSYLTTLGSGLTRLVVVLLTVGLALKFAKGIPSSGILRRLAVLFVFGLDVSTHTPRQNPPVPNAAYSATAPPMSSLPRLGHSRAMIIPPMQVIMEGAATADPLEAYRGYRRALFADCNLLDEIPQVYGFFSLYPRDSDSVISRTYKYTDPPPRILDFLGVSQISDPETLFVWHNRTNYLPLVTAGQRPVFAASSNALAAIFSSQFDPSRQVYLPPEAESALGGLSFASAHIESSRVDPQQVSALVDSSGTGIVVIAQAFYPTWKAYVDGKAVQLWKANHGFQAVAVPPGRHQLTVRYEDTMFRTGKIISALGVIATAVLFSWYRWKRPRNHAMALVDSNRGIAC